LYPNARYCSRSADSDLIDFASSLGFSNIGQAELENERNEYRAFIAPFIDSLATIGAKA
jgi:hypothetical protein